MKLNKKLVPLAIVTILAVGMTGAIALTGSNAGNQAIVVVNHQDGKSESKTGFNVAKDMGDIVDNQNAAAATSSGCAGCRTIAVAVQVIFAENHPTTAAPVNLALAINENCRGCETAAFSYQYYVSTEGPSHFTSEGNQAISSIRAQIADVAASSMLLPEVDGELGTLFSQLRAAVDQELVEKGVKFTGSAKKDADIAVGNGSPTPSPSDSIVSPSAGETSPPSVTPSPSDCPTPEESASPSPSPSPSPCPAVTATSDMGGAPSTSPDSSPSSDTQSSSNPSPSNDTPSPSPSTSDGASSTPSPEPSRSSSP
jgi:hypothetical protein